ncbi:MAG: glycoside hydrolase family 18 protein [Bacteroidetes bacterium]|nr:glycoside hydrolase family 18 protein [Bacteroidota bacterium]
MRFIILILIIFSCMVPVKMTGEVSTINFRTDKEWVTTVNSKDTVLISKFLKKLGKALSIKAKLREKEKKRVDAIITKYVKEANLISRPDLKRINDSLAKNHTLTLDSLLKLVNSFSAEKTTTTKQLSELKKGMDSLKSAEPPQPNEIEMDKLVDNLLPLIKAKASEEVATEQKNKKLKIIRSLINNPEGVTDTLEVNDSISKKLTLKLTRKQVFGFHPYWHNNQYYRNYNYSLLSTLIYLGYELNGKTGGYKDIHGWDKEEVVPYSKQENCNVQLGVFCSNNAEVLSFLKNNKAQENFCAQIIAQLAARNGDGVNIMLGSPGGESRLRLLKFIKTLHSHLAAANPKYKISLTIPALDKSMDYDIKALDPFVEYFIIDFTKKTNKGPIAPITGGDYSLDASISRYLNTNVPASKFIACMPYHGALWSGDPVEEFIDYIPYNEIAESYTNDYGIVYDNMSARTDVVFNKVDTVEQLWFDDSKTLSAKYDFILDNNLSGIAVWALGDDNNKPELWDAIMDKMITIDTTSVVILKTKETRPQKLSLWAKIKRELQLYKILFQHPCDFNATEKAEMRGDDYIKYVTLVLFILLFITGLFTILKVRALGDDWSNRRLFLSILIILVVLCMISVLMFCFLNPDLTAFGFQNGSCETSFGTILVVLGIGFFIGLLAMKFLVMPLLKPKEIP